MIIKCNRMPKYNIHAHKFVVKRKVMKCMLMFHTSDWNGYIFLPFVVMSCDFSFQGLVALYSEAVPMFWLPNCHHLQGE